MGSKKERMILKWVVVFEKHAFFLRHSEQTRLRFVFLKVNVNSVQSDGSYYIAAIIYIHSVRTAQ
jgi:hypothetical protein